jgi:hypothetical protein
VVRGEKVSLASVRRLATSLPRVLAAQTALLGDGYELRLVISGPVSGADLSAQLLGALRPAERPSRLSLQVESDGAALPHK